MRGPAEQTMHPPPAPARPRVQPIRDYRGRVVRKKPPPPESTRVGRLEKILIVVAFSLLLITVVVIVGLQLRSGPPADPRFVDGESDLANTGAAGAVAPVTTPPPAAPTPPTMVVEEATSTPAPTPAPTATPAPTPRPTERTSRAAATPARTPATSDPDPTEEATPRPVATGLLTVNTYPYSQVYIDGKSHGRTPLVGKSIRVGKHEVKLVFPTLGNEEVVETVFVEAGKEAKVVRRLTEGQ